MSVNATVEEIPTKVEEQPSVQEVQPTTVEEMTNTDDITSKNDANEAPKEIPITEVVIDNDIIGLNFNL